MAAVYESFNPDDFRYYVIHEGYSLRNLADQYGYSTATMAKAKAYFKRQGVLDIKSKDDVETDLREAMTLGVMHISRKLADKLDVSYDSDKDVWVINGYEAKEAKRDLPMEIKVRYDAYRDTYIVEQFEIREKPDREAKEGFQSFLGA